MEVVENLEIENPYKGLEGGPQERAPLNFMKYEKGQRVLSGMSIKNKPEENVFLPLQEVKVDVDITDSIAKTKINQVFYNPDTSEQPIEVQYKFPKLKDAVVARMVFTLDDRTIETKVEEKEKAQEKYDDAIAAGNTAVKMSQSKDDEELYEIDIGNIRAGQTVEVEIHLVTALKAPLGAFDYTLPLIYFP